MSLTDEDLATLAAGEPWTGQAMAAELRVVNARVDWLTLGYRVDLSSEAVEALDEAALRVREHGATAVRIGAVTGALKFARRAAPGIWHLSNDRYRMLVQKKATGALDLPEGKIVGWTVELIFSAQELAALGDVDLAVAEGRRLASSLGEVQGVCARRLDLCADIANFPVKRDLVDRLVRRSRANLHLHGALIDKEETPRAREHLNSKGATGITVCPGSPVMGRIYDKIEELKVCDVAGRADGRTAAEFERWRANGWDGSSPVTRVEFQLRGEAMKEFGIRNPEIPTHPRTGLPLAESKTLLGRVDAVWQACLQWLRLVNRTHSRLSECEDAKEWQLLKAVQFAKFAGPAIRVRVRKHASADQVLGCVLSIVGARVGLEPVRPWLAKYKAEPGREVRAHVRALYLTAADLTVDVLIDKWETAEKALEHVYEVHDAKRAYYDDETPGHRHARYRSEESEGVQALTTAAE